MAQQHEASALPCIRTAHPAGAPRTGHSRPFGRNSRVVQKQPVQHTRDARTSASEAALALNRPLSCLSHPRRAPAELSGLARACAAHCRLWRGASQVERVWRRPRFTHFNDLQRRLHAALRRSDCRIRRFDRPNPASSTQRRRRQASRPAATHSCSRHSTNVKGGAEKRPQPQPRTALSR
jgi:hypothetical protein